MSIQVFGDSHKGLVRENNQDRFGFGFINDDMAYAIVCDGMGGQNGGAIASEISMNFAKKILDRDLSDEMTELSIRAVFSSIFSATNALVLEASTKDPLLKGMGTTMILSVIKNGMLYVGSAGDSRVYIADREKQEQVTTDHTVVQMMVDSGQISKDDAAAHPKRHFITRAIGVADTVDMDFAAEKLTKDDIVLICSDGFYNYLHDSLLYPLLQQAIELKSVQLLIDLANNYGGHDNITAVVMA